MKKSYISPSTEVILLHTENMVAMSINFLDGEGRDQLSNKRE